MRAKRSSKNHLLSLLKFLLLAAQGPLPYVLNLFACTPPTGVDKPKLFSSAGSRPSEEAGKPLRERILGEWEVIAVQGKPVDEVSEDDVPFHQICIYPDGRIQMDTFQTDYEVAGEESGVVSLSYSAIGRESFLAIRLTEDGSAEIVETYQERSTNKRGESRVTAKKVR